MRLRNDLKNDILFTCRKIWSCYTGTCIRFRFSSKAGYGFVSEILHLVKKNIGKLIFCVGGDSSLCHEDGDGCSEPHDRQGKQQLHHYSTVKGTVS
jgi:hypothetical protein